MTKVIRTRNRILHILQLFERQERWFVEDIATEMATSVSSAYRDVQELCSTGFLAPVLGSAYVLGPAFVQYDRLLRQGDHILRAAIPEMRALLCRTTQHGVALLSRRYRDCVMCIHEERGLDHPPKVTYERGVVLPLFKGATSKAILAHLGEKTLNMIYLQNEEEIRGSLGNGSWKAFSQQMEKIRHEGVATTTSEVAKGLIGVAAPVFASDQVVAGLSLVVEKTTSKLAAFAVEVKAAAAALSKRLVAEEPWIPR